MSASDSSITTGERMRAWLIALGNKAVEGAVLTKIRWCGRVAKFDRWALAAVHQMMWRQVERMRRDGADGLPGVAASAFGTGVHNSRVVLSVPKPEWRMEAEQEMVRLQSVLGPRTEVHHIGSTAIEELAAKPIIDLAVALPPQTFREEFARVRIALGNAGYRYLGVRGGHFFEKGQAGVRTHAVQVHAAKSAELCELLRFRDALRIDPVLRTDYARTKAALAAHFPRQRLLYVTYKFHWIAEWQWRTGGAADWATWFVAHRRSLARMASDAR